MLTCPRCHSKYPAGVARCPHDGAALTPLVATVPPVGPTEDVIAASGGDLDVSVLTAATSPERPAAVRGSTPDTGSLAHGTGQASGRGRRRRARASTQPHESLGRVLGNYRLIELIGRGGMGWVYRAEHVKLGREVALKLLKPEYAARRDSVVRFFQEARAVNKIRHRNIVDITDFVELGDGTAFIIMELLRGQSLGELARGGLEPGRALAILVQICDALGAAHAVNIVHRDMKPDNVFICDTGDGADTVKLLDFGVAKLIDQEEEIGWQTRAGSVIGTPAYMSPEQAGGLQVDGRSDIYAVGAIMYELFTGEPMFRARSFGEYVRLHLNEQPVPPRQTKGGASMGPRLEAAILRCIDKSPSRRFANMQELQRELLALLGAFDTGMMPATRSGPIATRPTPVTGPHTPPAQPTVPPTVRHDAAPATRPRSSWLIAFALVLGTATGVAFFLSARGGEPASSATPPPANGSAANATPTGDAERAQPVFVPLAPTAPDRAAPRQITVRFTSDPTGAAVYAAGEPTSKCNTPCDVIIDPGDGGSPLSRRFELRRRGYRSAIATVELDRPPGRRHLVLDREATAPQRANPAIRVTPPVEEPDQPPPVVDEPPKKEKDPERIPPDRIDPEDTLDPFEN